MMQQYLKNLETLPFFGIIIASHSLLKGIEKLSQQDPEISLENAVNSFFLNLESSFTEVYEGIAFEVGKIMNYYKKAREKLKIDINPKISAKEYLKNLPSLF